MAGVILKFFTSLGSALVKARKPIAILFVGIVLAALYGAVIRPELTPWYFSVLVGLAMIALFVGAIVVIVRQL